ncbi:MAG: thiamine pyrophosphate-binding protein [Pseudomonadota bacterium]
MGDRPEQAPGDQVLPEYGDLILAYLEQLGVEYVFGIPGGAIEPFYNALARSERRGGPRAIVARHETGAAFMADGYARNTGKLGVCCATTGPGATNLITGVASAYENHIPMLVITAQTPLSTFGQGAFQESSCTGLNTVELFKHCTRYSTLVSHPGQIETKLSSALLHAFGDPWGPVHLSIPIDVMAAPYSGGRPRHDLAPLLKKPSLFDAEAVETLWGEIRAARCPVFLIGDGAGEAMAPILDVAVAIDAKIVTTPHGKGLISPFHPLYRGVIGFSGHREAAALLDDRSVDRIIVVGAHLGEWATGGWNRNIFDNRVIHVDCIEGNLHKTPMARLHVRGRISTVFEDLARRLGIVRRPGIKRKPTASANAAESPMKRRFTLDEQDKYDSDAVPIKPQRLMRELPNLLPPNTRYLADTGNSFSWTTHYLLPYDRRMAGARDNSGGLVRACLDFAPMGWAIGSAVGTALARPDDPVVCITGDGSMLMNGQEITVALQHGVRVIFIVLNDGELGMVRHGQRLTGAEQIGTELPKVDFAGLARAMGVEGFVIEAPRDLLQLDIAAICAKRGPTLLDVRIDRNEVPPIGVRTGTLRKAKTLRPI